MARNSRGLYADMISDNKHKTLTVRLHFLSALRFNTAAHHMAQPLNKTIFPESDTPTDPRNYGCFSLREVRGAEDVAVAMVRGFNKKRKKERIKYS